MGTFSPSRSRLPEIGRPIFDRKEWTPLILCHGNRENAGCAIPQKSSQPRVRPLRADTAAMAAVFATRHNQRPSEAQLTGTFTINWPCSFVYADRIGKSRFARPLCPHGHRDQSGNRDTCSKKERSGSAASLHLRCVQMAESASRLSPWRTMKNPRSRKLL